MDNSPVSGNVLNSFKLTVRTVKENTVLAIPPSGIVELKSYIGEIYYYESLLSPITTAKVLFVNTDKSIKLHEDLGLSDGGAEMVEISISDVVSDAFGDSDPGLNIKMYVDQVSNVQSTPFGEVFTMKLSSVWKESLESQKAIKGEVTANPLSIAQEIYQKNFNKKIEFVEVPTNTVTVNFGGEKKDDTLPSIMRLAAMSSSQKSAGFFFYQTKQGHHFKSADEMVRRGKSNGQNLLPYVFNGVNEGLIDNVNNARTIRTLSIRSNDWTVKNNARAAGPVANIAFDPITYNWYVDQKESQEEFFDVLDTETVTIKDESNFTKNAWSTNKLEGLGIMYRNPKDLCNFAEQPFQTKAKAKARYTSFFGRMIQMTVPVNTGIMAGETLKVNISRPIAGNECSTEDTIATSDDSGLYTVAGVCHSFSFGTRRAYSSVFLTRDQKKKRTQ